MSAPPASIEIADLVVCTDGRFAADLGVATRAGLVVEARKHDAKVAYLAPEKSAWIPLRSLRRATPEEAAGSPLGVAGEIFRRLGGKDLEVGAAPSGGLRVIVSHGAVTPDLLDALRSELGPRVAAWRLRPAGLSRIQSVMEIAG